MKILLLYGSPHKAGTTNELSEAFLAALEGKEYQIDKVYLSGMKVGFCKGCGYCKSHNGKCINQDDMRKIYPLLLNADVVCFVSPLYYFGFSGQLKTCIDRFYSINRILISQREKRCVLLTAGGDSDSWAMDGINANYDTMIRYLGWKSVGKVCALGCSTKEDLKSTKYLKDAFELGKQI